MKTTQEKLNEIRSSGYQLSFGQAFEQTFENYKKIALLGGAVILVVAIIFIVLYSGLGAMLGIASFMSGDLSNMRGLQTNTTYSLVTNLIVVVLTAGFIAPVTAGMLQMAHNAETYKEFSFSTAFQHYSSGHFKTIFTASLITTLFSQAIQLGFTMAATYTDSPLEYIAFFGLLGALIGWFIWILTLFMIPLIIFGNATASEAIKGSFMLGAKKFWILLLLSILVAVCAILGIVGLCIGVFFTAPIMYSFQYIVYRTAVDIDETDEMDEIGFNEESRFE